MLLKVSLSSPNRTASVYHIIHCNLSLNRSCSWGVVKESKLTKTLTRLIGFEVFWLLTFLEDLEAIKLTLIDHIQIIAILTLIDDCVVSPKLIN